LKLVDGEPGAENAAGRLAVAPQADPDGEALDAYSRPVIGVGGTGGAGRGQYYHRQELP